MTLQHEVLKEAFNELIGIVGPERVSDNVYFTHCYPSELLIRYGVELIRPPDIVISPRTTKEVSEVVKVANKYKLPIVAAGAQLALAGGVVPIKGGIMVDTRGMDRVIEIDKENLLAIVQPGITVEKLNARLEKVGLFYTDMPGSWTISTIGGRVSTNGCGVYAPKYGRPIEQVVSLEVVLPTGEVVRTGPRKLYDSNAGYDIMHLFLGDEGTLGIITELTLRVYPVPEYRRREAWMFPSHTILLKAIRKFLTIGSVPEMLLAHDGLGWTSYVWNFYQDYLKEPLPEIPPYAGMLLIGCGGKKEFVETQMKLCGEIMEEFNGKRLPEDLTEKWWTARLGKPYNPWQTVTWDAEKKYRTLLMPPCHVPISKAEEFVNSYRELAKKYRLSMWGLQTWIEGPNIHPCTIHPAVLYDYRKEDERERARMFKDEITRIAINLGGGIGGMFAPGLLYVSYIKDEFEPNALKLMKKIKQLIDPNNIMNPGKKFQTCPAR